MHFLLLILVLWSLALFFTVKQKSKNNKGLVFYILIVLDVYLAGVLLYFLASAVLN